ncbi:MAG: preprotein translocase subunit SecG, partial [Asticcacaulis sp. 32-58-5]
MLFGILLTVQIIICLALVGLVLIQRSEGGALGMGGSPSGFMSARGAGNFLTRTTSILAILFFANSIG